MAILRNHATQRKIPLKPLHLFGREHGADTLLASPYASQMHASIRWTGSSWKLHDHSRNGTWLNEERLPPGVFPTLQVADILRFGHRHDTAWIIEDLRAPGHLLWPLGHDSTPVELGCSNLLPPGSPAEMSILQTKRGQWLCKTALGSRVLREGDEVRLSGLPWVFVGVAEIAATADDAASPAAGGRTRPSLHFHVSLDEEHVRLQLHDQGTGSTLDLGEHTHHYALLTLARLRLEDAQRHQDSQAHGWVHGERLARMLGLEITHLNVQIFRLRKQFAQALPPDMAVPALVERRRGALRFGGFPVRITRGSRLEADFSPLEPISQPLSEEATMVFS